MNWDLPREAGLQREGTAHALDTESWQQRLAVGGWFEPAVTEVFRCAAVSSPSTT